VLGWFAILISFYYDQYTLKLPPPTPSPVVHIGGDEHVIILRLDNFVLGAFTDGTLCYGTKEPREADCKRAVPRPEIP
jgi:hypothetical protein